MTTLREAATQALKALEKLVVGSEYEEAVEAERAIYALRAALGEPVQEPVAWRWGYRSITTGEMDWRGYVEIAADPNLRSPEIIMQPLYTSPPQRKPLTEEEIQELSQQHKFDSRMEKFVRIIEQAHGIGGQNE